jgi:hypothetical protein
MRHGCLLAGLIAVMPLDISKKKAGLSTRLT